MVSDTEKLTRALLEAIQRKDSAAVADLIHPDATLTVLLSLTGEPEDAGRWVGKDQVLAYHEGAFARMGRIAFTGVRVSVADRGASSFVHAAGDFTTADSRSYRNVYLFRFDWRAGLVARIEEYANPITFLNTFGQP